MLLFVTIKNCMLTDNIDAVPFMPDEDEDTPFGQDNIFGT